MDVPKTSHRGFVFASIYAFVWFAFVLASRGWAGDAQSAGHAQYTVAWMYDLVYPSGVLNDADVEHFDEWFRLASRDVGT